MRTPREDLRVPDAEADLFIVGLGIGGFDQRSIEVDSLLRDAMVILHLTAFDAELRKLTTGRVEDLAPVYFGSNSASDVYERITEYVAQVAHDVRGIGHVCFLTYGHPLFLVDSSWLLLTHPSLRVKALPAVSFIDRIMVDLEARFDHGCQMYEANAMLKLRPRIDSRVPLAVSQVGEVGTGLIGERGRKGEWVAPLLDFVADNYPAGRRCDLVFSPYRRDMAPRIQSATVGELSALISSVHTGTTLYVHGE